MVARKTPKKVLVTGSAGLIGGESVRFFSELGSEVYGIDNDMRRYFFGDSASTESSSKLLQKTYPKYRHLSFDIRNQEEVEKLFKETPFELIIHTAAQPSHDWAAKEPHTDFSVNAGGTLGLLETTRKYAPDAVFVFTSTNKVYGDTPNKLPLVEKEMRFELPQDHRYFGGIDESMSIDNATHSIFGVSKAAADLMVQEYGKYFGMKTAAFRGGCLTGPHHAGAQLHGFLSYLVRSVVEGRPYTIFGYKGKQVRDNIHAHDVVNAFYHFYLNPRSGEVYNLGGGRESNISVLEAFKKAEDISGKEAQFTYVDTPRIGDHMWYVSDMGKFKSHYPDWKLEKSIDDIFTEIANHGGI